MIVGVIRNPVSGGGKAKARWEQLEEALRDAFSQIVIRETTAPGDAQRMAEEMAAAGFGLVIAVGGDGTVGDVVDGLLRNPGHCPEFAFIPAGTGSDFARNFVFDADPVVLVRSISEGEPRRIDAGKVTFQDHAGKPAARHFINITSLGISGEIAAKVNAVRSFGKSAGKLVFKYHTLKELLRFRFREVEIRLDDAPAFQTRIAVVVIANGPWFGGGMKIAPQADFADGILDVLVFRASSRLRLMLDLNSVYSGAHLKNPLVSVYKASRVDIRPCGPTTQNPPLIEVDGETPGKGPARYEVLPGAIMLRNQMR